ncbi:MAG: AAA family ATPase [Minisyncoccia bacterium]
MIKKIKIPNKYRTIGNNFELILSKLTVITGENNSGKTNFIQVAAKEAKDKKKSVEVEFLDENDKPLYPEIVYIAAENIKPTEDETKFSAKTSGLVKNLSKLFSNLEREFKLEKQDEIVGDIENLVRKANKNLKNFNGTSDYELEVKLNKEKLDPALVIQSLISDIAGLENGVGRGLDELGQGTQRIIVISILKAYVDILVEEKLKTENPVLIIIEEPEIYLHPKLKKALNGTLGNIIRQPEHQVIITTHDPYFAYTNFMEEDKILYSFFKEGGTTDKKEPDVIFGIEDEMLYIHLFEKVLKKAKNEGKVKKDDMKMDETSDLNTYLKSYSEGETRENIWPNGKPHKLALPLHIRHVIYHPGDEKNKFESTDLEKSVNILNKILSE